MVLGLMMIVCGVLGLPPCNGLIPNSPMHSKALIVYKTTAQKLDEQRLEDLRNECDAKKREDEGLADARRENDQKRRNSAQLEARRKSAQLDPNSPPPLVRRGSSQPHNENDQKPEELRTRRNSEIRRKSAQLEPSSPAQPLRLKPEFDHVVDQRLSNLLQSGMVAIMLLILPVVALVPSCVVTGLFLFMGVESLLDGDIYSRIMLPFVEKQNRVFLELGESITEEFLDENIKAVHVYTLIQLVAFGIVFYITQTVASIIFPVIILLLIPLRFRVLPRMSLFSWVGGQKSNNQHDAAPQGPTFFDVMDKPLIYLDAEPAVAVSADAAANSIQLPPEAVDSVDVGESGGGQYSMREQNTSGAVVVGIPPPPPDLLRAFYNPSVADSQDSL